jgi:hypothetical protein
MSSSFPLVFIFKYKKFYKRQKSFFYSINERQLQTYTHRYIYIYIYIYLYTTAVSVFINKTNYLFIYKSWSFY